MRLIDAEKLAEYKASGVSKLTDWQRGWSDAIDTIMGETPIVDAEPVRHGYNTHKNTPSLFKCSLCGWFDSDTYTGDTHIYNYCPHCGAKMDGERREDVRSNDR